ncbi:MAG: nucleoside monophosphate kinase [Candidatus Dojkabacteria bacterium]
MILLFIGPSGSGKDTQAEKLVEQFKFERVSTGDLMRGISDGEKEIQQLIRKSMDEGFLADNFVFGLLQIYLHNTQFENLVLSGAVRRDTQIDLLDFSLFKANKKLDKVVYFELSDEEAIKRMSNRYECSVCGSNYNLIFNPPKIEGKCDKNDGGILERREDDNPESIKKRLEDFHKDNEEILEIYGKRGILVRIDASKSIDEVYQQLVDQLKIKNQ